MAPSSAQVACAQNGVENEREALRIRQHVYGMVVMMPATHLEPGAVDADSLPIVGVLDVGRYPTGIDALAVAVAADLTAAGFRSCADADTMRWKYQKLLLNLAAALHAVCGPEADDYPAEAAARGLLVDALREEALECYRCAGISLPAADAVQECWGDAVPPKPIAGRPRVGVAEPGAGYWLGRERLH